LNRCVSLLFINSLAHMSGSELDDWLLAEEEAIDKP